MNLKGIVPALNEYLLAPEEAASRFKVAALEGEYSIRASTQIIGAPDYPVGLIATDTELRLVGDSSSIKHSAFVAELVARGVNFERRQFIVGTTRFEILLASIDSWLKHRLIVPHITLINLFHPEMYPTPRLTLGIGYIASHLRDTFSAIVTLIDCQFATTVRELIEHVKLNRPDVVGLSVNFGQYDLLTDFLDTLYKDLDQHNIPMIVLGNILPSMSPKNILARYPDLMVCQREGELMMEQLAKHYSDRRQWHRIPGAIFQDKQTKSIIRTAPQLINLDQLAPPAFDSAKVLLNSSGVITAEFSRGCHYNVCSFCPRTHKASAWRGMTFDGFTRHLRAYSRLFLETKSDPYLFFADEEFIGRDQHSSEHPNSRLDSFVRALKENQIPIKFDIAMRADQAFSVRSSDHWHYERGQKFRTLSQNGLQRIFVGVESGSDGQLLRYNKGTDVQGNISALRYLSLLGIKLRFGFITFDPLMSSDELCENIEFLARQDVVLSTHELTDVHSAFDFVRNHHGNYAAPTGSFVFEEVSYMASPLEVLLRSRYLAQSRVSFPDAVRDTVDIGFARVGFNYRNSTIYEICYTCQRWINYCFPILYTLKGLHKTSSGPARDALDASIRDYRHLTFHLLRTLAIQLGLVNLERIAKWEQQMPLPLELQNSIERVIKGARADLPLTDGLLSAFVEHFGHLLKRFDLIAQALPEPSRSSWCNIYENFRKAAEHSAVSSTRIM